MPLRPEELEDLASNDPDEPVRPLPVKRKGPPEAQPKLEPTEEQAANAGIQRQDDVSDASNETLPKASDVDVVVTEQSSVDVTLPHHNQRKVMHLTKQKHVVKNGNGKKDDGSIANLPPAVVTNVSAEGPALTISIDEIAESPSNPRKLFGDLEALSKSLVSLGFIQDIVVRPTMGGKKPYEAVVGHRRLRAAKMAGIAAVPCVVRTLNDSEALQYQMAENIERESLSVLEEAEGLHRLHTDAHLSSEDIGKRVGKSERWVQSRIQLLKLGSEARAALVKDPTFVSTAILLAAIPSHKLQADAVEVVGKPGPDGEVMSYRAAKEYLRENFTTELRGVAFDRKDDMLVPEAGPCTTCPKRTANNPELFSEYKRVDVCTDVVCFKKKMDAHWDAEREKAKAKGLKALSLQEGKRLFRDGPLKWTADYIDLSGICPGDKKKRTWRDVLGDKATDPALVAVTVAPDLSGQPHHLVLKEEALHVAKKAGMKWAGGAAEEAQHRKPASKAEKDQREVDEQIQTSVELAVLTQAVEQIEKLEVGISSAWLRLMCMGLAQVFRPDVLERRGLKNDTELQGLIEKTNKPAVLLGLVFEMSVSEWLKGHNGYSDQLKAMAKMMKIDLAAIEKATATTASAEALFKTPKSKGK
jgi:ParB/RepB/Spo0J family partition protein